MNYIIFHNLLMTVSVNIRTKIPLDNYFTEGIFYYSSVRLHLEFCLTLG